MMYGDQMGQEHGRQKKSKSSDMQGQPEVRKERPQKSRDASSPGLRSSQYRAASGLVLVLGLATLAGTRGTPLDQCPWTVHASGMLQGQRASKRTAKGTQYTRHTGTEIFCSPGIRISIDNVSDYEQEGLGIS